MGHRPAGGGATHLQFLQLLEDHVVGHVVKEPVRGREDDVPQLDVKGGAVCGVRTARTRGQMDTRLQSAGKASWKTSLLDARLMD